MTDRVFASRAGWKREGLAAARSSSLRVSRGETRSTTPVSVLQRLGSLRALRARSGSPSENTDGVDGILGLGVLTRITTGEEDWQLDRILRCPVAWESADANSYRRLGGSHNLDPKANPEESMPLGVCFWE